MHKQPAQRQITDALWKSYVDRRDPETRAQLLDQYLGLVHYAAREIAPRIPRQLELEDLISAGTVGLVQALESFDPSRGYAFSSHAVPRIRGAILDELRSWDWIPRSIRERSRRIRKVRDGLVQKLGREPEASEMAEALGVDLETYWRHADEMRDPVILTLDPWTARHDGEAPALSETIPDRSARDQFKSLAKSETISELREALESLSRRDRLILSLSFYERLTLRQIGEVLHITESRVCQLRSRATKRLMERMGIELEVA